MTEPQPPAEQQPKRRRWVPARRDAGPATVDGQPVDRDGWVQAEDDVSWQWDRRQWR